MFWLMVNITASEITSISAVVGKFFEKAMPTIEMIPIIVSNVQSALFFLLTYFFDILIPPTNY